MVLVAILMMGGLFSSGQTFGQGMDTDALWQKGVDYMIGHRTWIPGKIHSYDEEKDGNGKVTKVTESWSRCFLNDKGKIDMEIVKVLENGTDITKKVEKEIEKTKKNKPQEGDGQEFDPFSPEALKNVTYQAKEHSSKNGQPCQSFDYRQKIDEKQYQKGTIWLDEKTGAPMEIVFMPDPMPQGLKHMQTTIKYRMGEDGTWYAEKMLAEGDGSFLGMKMSFSSNATLSDYWKCPESALSK